MIRVACFVMLMMGLGIGTAPAAEPGSAERPLTMMFVPSGEAQVILKGGEEISRRLTAVTGLHFKSSIATSYAAVVEAMGAGKVDIGWLAPFAYVLAKERYGVELLFIVQRFGSPFYRGQIVTRADSGIRSLKDLAGKRFAFVDPASTSGHLYPKALLRAQGFSPQSHLGATVFAGSHNAVILSVLKGEVDAGATYDDARAELVKAFPGIFEKIRVIAHTREIPNDTVSVRKELSADIRQRIKEGLVHLAKTPEGSKVLKRTYAISGFMDFDGLYDPVREAGRLLDVDPSKLNP
ncbi:phosphate/phosphite/phosphonate ABC transporter substrate-binding protein [Nitrospina watsonii]|uniref:Phosphonate ABC transporter phosphate-binding periplasmic component (TC 3.A.1.9.1) n=1 Tax=Nitrospina watsonii TaxID=1323948 RepID=A0ABN8W0I1_9BACT|nr:phosphate/phosphite/phosphonate ABC transporter substrate-binding protein [Nitrospina watsonii]CAI2719108.1 Phosphonate ABC transporter phosphate-binding periplasmic component (TC 3.A.1.9.1) [Nitrospina watsonii]